jgi:hypothetical protein
MNALIYTLGNSMVGGLADRMFGMAAVNLIAQYTGSNFYIDFKNPFDYFDNFSGHKRLQSDWDSRNIKEYSRIVRLNLVDENFNQDNLAVLFDALNLDGCAIFVQANQLHIEMILPFLLDRSEDAKKIQGLTLSDIVFQFGFEFAQPNLEKFGKEFLQIYQELIGIRAIGLAIRVGGSTSGWIDSRFQVPSFESISNRLEFQNKTFDAIFVASDNINYKSVLIQRLQRKWKVLSTRSDPAHLERSCFIGLDVVKSSLFDHCLLRACSAGVVTGGGRYGVSAAYLSGSPLFPLLSDENSGPVL